MARYLQRNHTEIYIIDMYSTMKYRIFVADANLIIQNP